jgi:hypothetical protein
MKEYTMARRKQETHDQTSSTPREEEPDAKDGLTFGVPNFPKNNLPYTYFPSNQSAMEELIAAWNKLFRRRSTP